jgi:hypothetical protein
MKLGKRFPWSGAFKGDTMTNMKSLTRISFLAFLLFGLGGTSAFAQFLSGIEGTAKDQSGALIVGAKVTVTDTQIGVSKTTTTNQSGYFRIDSIAASTYTVKIEQTGFKAWDQKELTLQVGEIRTLPLFWRSDKHPSKSRWTPRMLLSTWSRPRPAP